MKKFVLSLVAAALTLTVLPARAADLATVLHQLDTASANFRNAQADVRQDQYTKVVDATDISTGTVYFRRAGSTAMAAQYRTLNGKPETKTVVYDGVSMQLYQPRIHQITKMSAGKNKNQYESFLTLGFGGSGKDLAANWEIQLIGTETMKDGATAITVAHLDLVSKQESARNMFSKISIWVDPVRGVSLKQIFYQPNGDLYTAFYSNIKLNAGVDPKVFTLDAKALGATTVNR